MAPSQRQPKSQYACQYPNCKSTFTREPDRSRHERDVHKAQKHFCNQPGCNHRGAVRKDVFENHMRLKHPQYSKYLDVPEDLQQIPEDSPKSQSPLQDNQILEDNFQQTKSFDSAPSNSHPSNIQPTSEPAPFLGAELYYTTPTYPLSFEGYSQTHQTLLTTQFSGVNLQTATSSPWAIPRATFPIINNGSAASLEADAYGDGTGYFLPSQNLW